MGSPFVLEEHRQLKITRAFGERSMAGISTLNYDAGEREARAWAGALNAAQKLTTHTYKRCELVLR